METFLFHISVVIVYLFNTEYMYVLSSAFLKWFVNVCGWVSTRDQHNQQLDNLR